MGGAIWVGLFAGYAVVLASRRELGVNSIGAWAVALISPVGLLWMFEVGRLDHLGVVVEYRNVATRYWAELLTHVELAATAIVLATSIGVGLGVLAYVRPAMRRPVFATVNLLQTVPGLALIGMLVAPFGALANRVPALRTVGIGGLGWAPVVFALTLYALLPVTRNTFAGLEGVSAPALEAGRGMGMTHGQLLRRVHLPLAAPVVFTGIRTTSEQAVGNTVLGAFAAAGGLGLFVFEGLSQQSTDLIVLGSLGVVILALIVDALMRGVERVVFGRRGRRGSAL
jgi:osmoprotectant transport system permease protein